MEHTPFLFDTLPYDIATVIMSFATFMDRLHLGRVNRVHTARWREYRRTPECQVKMREWCITRRHLKKLFCFRYLLSIPSHIVQPHNFARMYCRMNDQFLNETFCERVLKWSLDVDLSHDHTTPPRGDHTTPPRGDRTTPLRGDHTTPLRGDPHPSTTTRIEPHGRRTRHRWTRQHGTFYMLCLKEIASEYQNLLTRALRTTNCV